MSSALHRQLTIIVDREQLKPDVADPLEEDWIDSLEQDLAAEPSKEICLVTANDREQVFHQAWFPFFQGPALQTPPFQARVFQGPSVSVPRQFMAVTHITAPKPGTGEFLIILALFSLK